MKIDIKIYKGPHCELCGTVKGKGGHPKCSKILQAKYAELRKPKSPLEAASK